MTRNELITKLCKEEGGKRQALDAGQGREVVAKLRRIIAENFGVDLDDIIRQREACKIYTGHSAAIAYRYLPMGPDGVHLLPKHKRTRKPAKRRAGK
ncbi:MAG: hypothetical protein IT366_21440 [Candidatus Hydrogenedentes bacterium]|nr:hypothetical protein [Candidatus Hydrogenedentota bacterium]